MSSVNAASCVDWFAALAAMVSNSATVSVPAALLAAITAAMGLMLFAVTPVTPKVCKAANKSWAVGALPPSVTSSTTLAASASAFNSVALSTSTAALRSTALLSKVACAAVPVGAALKTPKA